MTCEHCGDTMVRCVVQWEDGSASIMWRCACEVEVHDLYELHHGVDHVSMGARIVGMGIVCPDEDDADTVTDSDRLGTRGWA